MNNSIFISLNFSFIKKSVRFLIRIYDSWRVAIKDAQCEYGGLVIKYD